MILALTAALVIVTLYAIGQGIFIRRLLSTMASLDAAEKPVEPEPAVTDRGRAVVDLLCASIVEKPEQWAFKQGVLKHNRGTAISLTDDGQSVQIKRGKDISIVDGSDGRRIREAVLTRNLRASFEDIATELVN